VQAVIATRGDAVMRAVCGLCEARGGGDVAGEPLAQLATYAAAILANLVGSRALLLSSSSSSSLSLSFGLSVQ
jgi:hypothetical protein